MHGVHLKMFLQFQMFKNVFSQLKNMNFNSKDIEPFALVILIMIKKFDVILIKSNYNVFQQKITIFKIEK
jgi:hypothetical protein